MTDGLPERPIAENCWEVAPGLFRILLPLPWDVPFVNAYLVQAPGGWILIDAGAGTPASLRALGWALKAAGVPEGGLAAILLTHRHPDHAGDVIAVQQRWGGAVYVHPADRDLDRADPAVLEAWIRLTGMPSQVLDTLLRRAERMPLPADAAPYPATPALAEAEWQRDGSSWVERGDTVPGPVAAATAGPFGLGQAEPRGDTVPGPVAAATLHVAGLTLEVAYVPGHSPGHVMLRVSEKGWVFTGDHVLPRAGINVWANPVGPANPMGAYLDNLTAVAWLDSAWGMVSGGTGPAAGEDPGAGERETGLYAATGVVGAGGKVVARGKTGAVRDPAPSGLVLPGHGLPWSGPMVPQARALADWHRRAALALRDRLPDEPGPTAFEMVAARRPDDARHKPHRLRGAVAETLAFLLWLEGKGLAGRRGEAPARWYRLPGRHLGT